MLIPGTVVALVASLGAIYARRQASVRVRLMVTVATVVIAELLLTALNTVALYIDGAILGYSVKALHLLLPARLLNGVARAVISSILVPLLYTPLHKVLTKLFPRSSSTND